jgi:hypothetical protein
VLAALRRRGRHGITRVDFQLPDVIDHGAPILNFPARIKDLKEQGHRIGDNGRRDKCKVYVLLEDADESPQTVRPVVGLRDHLFTPPPRNAIFDEDAA